LKDKKKKKKIYVVHLLVWIINKMSYTHITEEDGNIGGAQCDLSNRIALHVNYLTYAYILKCMHPFVLEYK
jgi:hypothetical protein